MREGGGAGGELVVTERRPRVLSPLREHLRDTFRFAPLSGLVVGALSVVCVVVDRADRAWVGTLRDEGRAGVLRDVHVARVCRVARRQGVVVHLLPRIGDFLVPGTPVITVHQRDGGREVGGRVARVLASTPGTGVERTFHQDLGFGLRQLVDIALRALSPAMNDPTTAVRCLDRVQQFLTDAADRPLGLLAHTDRRGAVRMVQDLPGSRDLVRLGFSGIRAAAPGNARSHGVCEPR